MAFFQDPPRLGNQYRDDRVLRSMLARKLPEEVYEDIEPSLDRMGDLAAGRLLELSQESRRDEPELTQWDAWGRRIDEIRVPQAWKEFARVAVDHGLVSTAYERRHGEWSRMHQFALVYLFDRSTSVYTCPLAMTDGAAKTLQTHASPELRDRVVTRLLARTPSLAWTAGQWMTERTGGSDVGLSETVAKKTEENGREVWRLYGTKWFTSATTSEMALTLARPEGNPPGGKGLALFYVEQRLPDGGRNNILVNRLKDKLGTRMLPTAELTLDGAIAEPVAGLSDGIRNIAPMLNITRTWNAVCSAALLRRCVALARDYATRREAFGSILSDKPLHLETLAQLESDFEAAFHLVFRGVELLGREEAGIATDAEIATLRLLQPIAKLVTAKQAVAGASECLECFAGAGYIEDTGLPALLRDGQVLPIWEGTTNVLALDAIRAIRKDDSLRPYLEEVRAHARAATHPRLAASVQEVLRTADRAQAWLPDATSAGPVVVESGARRFAMTLGRVMELALLLEQAQWDIEEAKDGRTATAARRMAAEGVDFLTAPLDSVIQARALAMDEDLLLLDE